MSNTKDDKKNESRIYQLQVRKLQLECWRIRMKIALLLLTVAGVSHVSGTI